MANPTLSTIVARLGEELKFKLIAFKPTEGRECPECGNIHDCAFFIEMQVLTEKLDKKINEFVEQYQKVEKTIHELEDK